VCLQGLVARSDLNGRAGIVVASAAALAEGRVLVALVAHHKDDASPSSTTAATAVACEERVRVRPANLVPRRATRAPSAVGEALTAKLSAAPLAALENCHRARALLPRAVAFALSELIHSIFEKLHFPRYPRPLVLCVLCFCSLCFYCGWLARLLVIAKAISEEYYANTDIFVFL